MVISLRSPLRKFCLVAFSTAVALCYAVHIVRRAYAQWCLQHGSRDSLEKAVSLDPGECEGYFRLALYYSFATEEINRPRGEDLLRRALRCQPLKAGYWLGLASVLNADESAIAAQRAAALEPYNSLTLWRSGNFMLMAGKTDEAFDMFRRSLLGAPDYAPQVFKICWRSSDDGDKILRQAVPDTVEIDLAYLNFLTAPDMLRLDEARKVWYRLLALRKVFPVESTFGYFDALLHSGRTSEAVYAWEELVLVGVLPPEESRSAGSVMVNGGFEAEPVNGGLDWRITPVAGVGIETDRQVHHGGAASLAIHFEGLSNVDFQHVAQMDVVDPNTDYYFRAFMKSRALSTRAGPHFEIFDPEDVHKYQWETPDVLGTTEWSAYSLKIHTGPKTRLLTVRLRRKPALELDKRIEGTLWVDDVQLAVDKQSPDHRTLK